MSPRSGPCLLVLAVSLALFGCEKIETPTVGPATLAPVKLAQRDAIPLEYGDLVGVTPAADVGGVVFYFQKPDKTIVTVYVNMTHGVIGENVVEIPRR